MVALCNSILPAHLKETKVNIMARLYELPQFFILQVSNALAESLQPGMCLRISDANFSNIYKSYNDQYLLPYELFQDNNVNIQCSIIPDPDPVINACPSVTDWPSGG